MCNKQFICHLRCGSCNCCACPNPCADGMRKMADCCRRKESDARWSKRQREEAREALMNKTYYSHFDPYLE